MSLNRLLGVPGPEPERGKAPARNSNFADNRLIVLGNNSVLVDELKKLRPHRSEDSVLIDWTPQSASTKNLVQKITAMEPVEIVDLVIVNSCVPDHVTSEREMRKIFSEIRLPMKAISSSGIAEKTFRWWMCVELEDSSPATLNIWQASGRLVFRHAAESPKLVGTLVLVGDAAQGASDLRTMLDSEHVSSARVLGFGLSENGSFNLDKGNNSMTPISKAHEGGNLSAVDLPNEKNYLIAEIEMAKDSLTDLAGELRQTQQNLNATNASLVSKRDDAEKIGLEMAVQSHELFAVETDLTTQRGIVAVMADQADSLRREIEYLMKHHASLTETLVNERAALQVVRDEMTLQVARAEQIQSALTRAEIDASHQRTLSDEAIRLAEAAHARLNEIIAETTNSQQILTEVKDEVTNRKQELIRLDIQRAQKAKETAEYEETLTTRSSVLQRELETMQQMQREVVATLESARAERTVIHAELAKLADSGNDPQVEILRISRDFLTVELAQIEGAKARTVKETDLIRSTIDESRELAAEFEQRRAAAQQQFDQIRAKVIEIQEKEIDAQLALNTLEDKISVFQKERDELDRYKHELAQRVKEIDEAQNNFESEVAKRISAHLDELSAMSSRARKKAIKQAVDNVPSVSEVEKQL